VTQAIAGYIGKVYVSDDGGSTYVEVGETRDVKFNNQQGMFDATSHGSGGNKEVIPGIRDWSATIGALYVSSDVAQDKLASAVAAGTKLKFRFDPEGTATGKERFAGDGYLTNFELSYPNADLITENVQITGSGALVKSTQ
jgi:predicted secreted protein